MQTMQKETNRQAMRRVTPQKLSLTATGSFRVLSAKDTTVRCGPHKMPRTIQYTVTIGSRVDLLDSRGFIIDWRDIFKEVAHHYKYVNVFPACETFAAEIAGIVARLLDGKCVSIVVNVSIKGLPANMTAEWDAPEPMDVVGPFSQWPRGSQESEQDIIAAEYDDNA